MKRTILILVTAVLGFTSLNATTENTRFTNETSLEITSENIVEVYDWKVITKNGESAGTAMHLKDAKRMIALFSKGENILEQQIKSYKILKSEAQDTSKRLYFWKVESNYAKSEGFASTKAIAQKMIASVAKGDVITYRVIASKKY